MADDDAGGSWSSIPGRGFQGPAEGGDLSDPSAGPVAWEPPPAYSSYAPTKKSRSKVGVVAVALGVLATLGGAVFAATQIAGDEGSPEKAVEKLLDAVSQEDVLGALEAIPPSERDSLKGGVTDIFEQAKRLQLLSDDADLGKLAGVDIEFQDVKLASKPLRDDLASVSFVGGTATTSADPKRLPLGSFVKEVAGSALAEAEPTSDTSETTGDDVLVTVKEDGKWYVSIWYSVAEAARRGSGARDGSGPAVPDKAAAIEAKGADSPEEAIDALLRAGATLDLRRLIELMPPDEARALHEYAPLFLSDAESGAAELRQFFTIDIGTLELAADTSGDESLVTVKKFNFTGRFGPPEESFQLSYTDGCATFGGPGVEQQRFCASELRDNPEQFLEQFGIPGFRVPNIDIQNPAVGFVTVKRDGKWYVSPTRTVLEDFAAVLRVLERRHLDEFRRFAEDVSRGVEEEDFGSVTPD